MPFPLPQKAPLIRSKVVEKESWAPPKVEGAVTARDRNKTKVRHVVSRMLQFLWHGPIFNGSPEDVVGI